MFAAQKSVLYEGVMLHQSDMRTDFRGLRLIWGRTGSSACYRQNRKIMEDGMQILSFSSKTAGALLAASLTAVAASAADLPVRAPPPAVVYAPVSNWTGCYVGGNLGGAWGSREITTDVGTFSGSNDSARFAGGGQIGCDYQSGAWVFGIRNLFDVADAKASRTVQSGPYTGYSAELKNNWLDLLTGRIGYAAQPNWLL